MLSRFNFLYSVRTFSIHSSYMNMISIHETITRHGPKPDSHEAEAVAFTKLEAEALTLINLEAEALVMKPKPGYMYYCNQKDWLQSRSFGKPRSRSL